MTPITINIYQTSKCNQSCPFCKRQLSSKLHTDDIDPDFLAEVLNTYPSIKTACVAGFGEPLLSSTIAETLAQLKGRGIWTSLITNGTLVPERFSLVKEFDAVNVSINAGSKQEHIEKTGLKYEWDNVLSGVRALVAKKVDTTISFVVGKSDIGNVISYIQLGRDLGVKVALHNVLPHGVGDHAMNWFRGEVIQRDSDEEKFLLNLAHSGSCDHVIHWPNTITIDRPTAISRCSGPFQSIGIDGDKNVSVCPRCWAPNETGVKWSGEETFESPIFQAMRHAIRTMTGLDTLCKNCFGHYRG